MKYPQPLEIHPDTESPIDGLLLGLEYATRGDEVLDRAIANILKIEWSSDEDGQFGGYNILPRRVWFTRNLAATQTLCPRGWEWSISNRPSHPRPGHAYVHNNELHFIGVGATPNPNRRAFEVVAATPELAACIAFIKAKWPDRPPRGKTTTFRTVE